MKKNFLRKCIAGAIALCLCGGAMGAANIVSVCDDLTACAASETGEKKDNGEFTYYKYNDHIEIKGVSWDLHNSELTEINIPDEIDSLPVTVIGESAFIWSTWLTSLTLPKTLKVIKASAFHHCENLKSVTIPDSVVELEANAFSYCYELETVKLSKNIQVLGNRAFMRCNKLKSIELPETLTIIPDSAFDYCESLEEVVVPAKAESVGTFAFHKCRELKKITFLNPDCTFKSGKLVLNNDGNTFSGTIYGYNGSTAEKYAEMCGYNFESLGDVPSAPTQPETPSEPSIPSTPSESTQPSKPSVPAVNNATFGDINGDESIDSSDASLVLVEYSSLSTGGGSLFTTSMTAAADVNKDETVDSSDASLILGYYSYVSTGGKEKDMAKWIKNK